jgi:RNA polymerase sigma-70 factor, ECF subfamily
LGLRTLKDDRTLWLQAYEAHGPSILAFLTSRIGRRDLAEELLQETFVRAMRRGPEVASLEHLRAYLFTTAHHLLVDDRRRHRMRLFSELTQAEESSITKAPAEATESSEIVDLDRIRERLEQALSQLSPPHRAAFQAAVLEQKPYAAIAREQEWTMEQVKINVHRARKKVIAMLGDLARPKQENRS